MSRVATTGLTISGVPYGENVRAGDLVGWNSGKLMRACGMVGNVVPAVGVAAASYKNGDEGALHLMSEVSGLADLAEGDTQYLSLSAPGDVQSTVPTGMGNLKQAVGYAVAPDRIAVVIRDEGTVL
ncbi:MAG: hypothetical protein ACYC66_14130 [Chloroflexota bacterium]